MSRVQSEQGMNRTIPLRATISGIRKHLGHFSFYCFGPLLMLKYLERAQPPYVHKTALLTAARLFIKCTVG
jgi:hypothetical protein